MKYLKTYLILLLMLLILSCESTVVFGQAANVSLETTMKWLTEKINASANWRDRGDSRNSSVLGHNGCSMRLGYSSPDTDYPINTTEVIDLAFLSKVTVGPYFQGVSTDRAAKLYLTIDGEHVEKIDNIRNKRKMLNYAVILFGDPNVDNEELANRVAKAFENLKTICNKRAPEPF